MKSPKTNKLLDDDQSMIWFADYTHELRTLLNGIALSVDIIKESESEDERSEFLDLIDVSTDFLLEMMNTGLHCAKASNGEIELEQELFDPIESVENELKLISPLALICKTEVSMNVKPGVQNSLIGDKLRFRQIVRNLVSNAVRYSKRGKVEVALSRNCGTDGSDIFEIKVKDTGMGMSKEQLLKVQDLDDSQMKLENGKPHGFGLYFCRKLVQLMNGTLEFTSELGKGTCVRVNLPFEHNKKYDIGTNHQ